MILTVSPEWSSGRIGVLVTSRVSEHTIALPLGVPLPTQAPCGPHQQWGLVVALGTEFCYQGDDNPSALQMLLPTVSLDKSYPSTRALWLGHIQTVGPPGPQTLLLGQQLSKQQVGSPSFVAQSNLLFFLTTFLIWQSLADSWYSQRTRVRENLLKGY